MNYIEVNLIELLKTYEEEQLQTILSHFKCPLNRDVEQFIQTNAITFSKQRIAITYLVFSDETPPNLVGYFTLANKFVSIIGNVLSKTLQKRISKFSQYDYLLKRFFISMPLIAQLGKNFAPEISTSISGQDLLSIACHKILEAQRIIGGKTTYIECADNPNLYHFYSKSQFIPFGHRNRDTNEIVESQRLIQMLKYFKE